MRKLNKAQKPQVLVDSEEDWLAAFEANPSNTNATRYRHADIKQRIREETNDKCIYCEQKMLPVTSSHIEHKIPVSVDEAKRFFWENLTLACPECNRLKNDFYDNHDGFLDPYEDDVEALVTHRGPISGWLHGNVRAELSVKFLGLDGAERAPLILKKVQAISALDDAIERYLASKGTAIEAVHKKRLARKAEKDQEFSAMVRSIFEQNGFTELL